MPKDNNGVYTAPAGNPVVADTEVTADWANATTDDLYVAINDNLSRSGDNAMAAPLRAVDGTAIDPAYNFQADPTNSGFWFDGADVQVIDGDVPLSLTGAEAEDFYASTQLPLGDSGSLPPADFGGVPNPRAATAVFTLNNANWHKVKVLMPLRSGGESSSFIADNNSMSFDLFLTPMSVIPSGIEFFVVGGVPQNSLASRRVNERGVQMAEYVSGDRAPFTVTPYSVNGTPNSFNLAVWQMAIELTVFVRVVGLVSPTEVRLGVNASNYPTADPNNENTWDACVFYGEHRSNTSGGKPTLNYGNFNFSYTRSITSLEEIELNVIT